MTELNPNHPVTQAVRGEWAKLLALVMHKLNMSHIVITRSDIHSMPRSAIVVRELSDGIHLGLVDEATGEQLAREEGGLPI